MKLYHGSIYSFDKIDVSKGKTYKDFGKGFYTTTSKKHACSIAKRNKKIEMQRHDRKTTAYIYELELDKNNALYSKLNIKIFDKPDKEWLIFVINNRLKYKPSKYDIVIGPIADDNAYAIINMHGKNILKNAYTSEEIDEIINTLKPDVYPKQIFFATKRASQLLSIKCRKEVK